MSVSSTSDVYYEFVNFSAGPQTSGFWLQQKPRITDPEV